MFTEKPVLLRTPEVILSKIDNELRPGKLVHIKIPKDLRTSGFDPAGYNGPKRKSFVVGFCIGTDSMKGATPFAYSQGSSSDTDTRLVYVLFGNYAEVYVYQTSFTKTKSKVCKLVQIFGKTMFVRMNERANLPPFIPAVPLLRGNG